MDDTPHTPPSPSGTTKIGPLLGILVILALLLAGAVYFFLEQKERFNTPPVRETINV